MGAGKVLHHAYWMNVLRCAPLARWGGRARWRAVMDGCWSPRRLLVAVAIGQVTAGAPRRKLLHDVTRHFAAVLHAALQLIAPTCRRIVSHETHRRKASQTWRTGVPSLRPREGSFELPEADPFAPQRASLWDPPRARAATSPRGRVLLRDAMALVRRGAYRRL